MRVTNTIGAVLIAVALPISNWPAMAATATSNTTTTVTTDDFVYSDPCTGEDVHVTGTTVTVTSTSLSSSGIEHVTLSVTQTDTGVGLTSAANYTINGQLNEQVNIKLVGESGEENVTLSSNVIGQGRVPNEQLKERLKVTVNANGTTTVERVSISDICKGKS